MNIIPANLIKFTQKMSIPTLMLAGASVVSSCTEHDTDYNYLSYVSQQKKTPVMANAGEVLSGKSNYIPQPLAQIDNISRKFGALQEDQSISTVPAIRFYDENSNSHYFSYNQSLNNRPDTIRLEYYIINPDNEGVVDTLKLYNQNDMMIIESKNGKTRLKQVEDTKWNEYQGDKVVAQWYPLEKPNFVRDSADVVKHYTALGASSRPCMITFDADVAEWMHGNDYNTEM